MGYKNFIFISIVFDDKDIKFYMNSIYNNNGY